MTPWANLEPELRNRLLAARARNREEAKQLTRLKRERRGWLPRPVRKNLAAQPVHIMNLLECCRRLQYALDRGPMREKVTLTRY